MPPATGTTATSAAASQPVQLPVAKAPAPLSTLPAGTVVSGTVTPSEDPELLKILTRYGSFELTSKLALPEGTRVALQIRDNGQIRLQVVAPDGTPQTPEAQAKTLADAAVRLPHQILTATLESRGTTPFPAAGSPNISPGGQPSGHIPAPASGGPASPAAAPNPGNASSLPLPAALQQLSAGARFQIQLTAINSGSAGATTNQGAQSSLSGQSPVTNAAPANALTAAGGPAATRPDPVLSGTVIASAAKGRPVLQTSFGILSLDNGIQLPLGTRVQIQVLANSLPQPASSGALNAPSALQPATGSMLTWPSLDAVAAQSATNGLSGPLASKILQRIPAAGAALGSNMLFLLSALNTGQLSGWLGRATLDQMQREGQGDLATKLDQDFAQAGRISDAGGGEWRTLILPFLDDNQIRQLRLFIRRDQDDAEGGGHDQSAADATRFLLEIELSELGDLQLDGLIRAKLFDLVLRTRKAFSQATREEIIRIFSESNHDLGLAGQIFFEASDEWRSKTLEIPELVPSPDLMI